MQVCQRLDGIPLAIELAAARVKVLAVEQIAVRLADRFRLLTGGSRMVLPRQQTLRAKIDWSYNLLSEPGRVLLRRLSVFAGGWTLEAAEAVCAGGGVEAAAILNLANVRHYQGDDKRARELVEEALTSLVPLGAKQQIAVCLLTLGTYNVCSKG